jgi:hypothetical protein
MHQLKLIFCLLLSAVAPSVKAAEVCRDIIGEDQSVEVAAGKTARVMFFLRGPEAGYIEICKIHGQKTELVFAAAAEASGWYQTVDLPAETAKFQAKNYSAWIAGPIPHSWTGVRRSSTPDGYTFNWFENADDSIPNMIVEFCLQGDPEKCPSHSPVQRAKNLAGMSEDARKRWLSRWAEKHGYKTSRPH